MGGELDGKVALVTGAAGGLGVHIAKAFVREGARVLMVDRDAERLALVLQEVGASAQPFVADLALRPDCLAAVEMAVETFGQLDILCNNAAILSFDHFDRLAPEVWEAILAVNLSAPPYLSQAAISTSAEVQREHCQRNFVRWCDWHRLYCGLFDG